MNSASASDIDERAASKVLCSHEVEQVFAGNLDPFITVVFLNELFPISPE